jgi:hypothetical protein
MPIMSAAEAANAGTLRTKRLVMVRNDFVTVQTLKQRPPCRNSRWGTSLNSGAYSKSLINYKQVNASGAIS